MGDFDFGAPVANCEFTRFNTFTIFQPFGQNPSRYEGSYSVSLNNPPVVSDPVVPEPGTLALLGLGLVGLGLSRRRKAA